MRDGLGGFPKCGGNLRFVVADAKWFEPGGEEEALSGGLR
jgi:hypothetical protein